MQFALSSDVSDCEILRWFQHDRRGGRKRSRCDCLVVFPLDSFLLCLSFFFLKIRNSDSHRELKSKTSKEKKNQKQTKPRGEDRERQRTASPHHFDIPQHFSALAEMEKTSLTSSAQRKPLRSTLVVREIVEVGLPAFSHPSLCPSFHPCIHSMHSLFLSFLPSFIPSFILLSFLLLLSSIPALSPLLCSLPGPSFTRQTEKTYLDGLQALVDVFIRPLTELCEKKKKKAIATVEERETLFRNVQTILAVHQDFYDALHRRYQEWFVRARDRTLIHSSSHSSFHPSFHSSDSFLFLPSIFPIHQRESNPEIGDLFLRFAPWFKLYTPYVNRHDDASELLRNMLSDRRSVLQYFLSFLAIFIIRFFFSFFCFLFPPPFPFFPCVFVVPLLSSTLSFRSSPR